jgi:hypothetical protein
MGAFGEKEVVVFGGLVESGVHALLGFVLPDFFLFVWLAVWAGAYTRIENHRFEWMDSEWTFDDDAELALMSSMDFPLSYTVIMRMPSDDLRRVG